MSINTSSNKVTRECQPKHAKAPYQGKSKYVPASNVPPQIHILK